MKSDFFVSDPSGVDRSTSDSVISAKRAKILLKCLRVFFTVVADIPSPVCSYFLTVYNYIIREGRRNVNQKNAYFLNYF
jgi:hypothetical protein